MTKKETPQVIETEGAATARPRKQHAAHRQLDVPRAQETAADGLLIIDKPAGVTSHDVVSCTRRLAATRKVGHAGTLDPMATGMLIVGVGKATRLLHYITGADKGYFARISLGISTDTDDADGEIIAINSIPSARETTLTGEIDAQLGYFRGDIMQRPTTVSAIKVGGKRAHALHRAGESVELAARPVTVSVFERLSEVEFTRIETEGETITVAEFDVRVECSSGTYVRALARDLGAALGLGGCLTELRRFRIGNWKPQQMQTIEELGKQVTESGKVQVLPLTEACLNAYDSLELTEAEAISLCNGNTTQLKVTNQKTEIVAALYQGQVRALIQKQDSGFKPLVVFETQMPKT
ncbi:tRNA pseudouridine(55) synthase TruB [Gleimia sp. 6138-11-ORH1]|uniref:tRNA pseudouridine(55) synthase TruB n=1 Tax=Gleimia sp. 6138-11-ORH1 TaxID=2973937 RepID=UPI00216A4CE7|nr:tRNA pseudouridine(55) synthase TruB [Gleimia sp. 6138-11-ORH1]MCS4484219.1 tRNA pseudouridine(55) synthase TruB [Gleimia sp. 6138-11-ORH1]